MLDREQVRKVANLARLDLTDAEEAQFTTQLSGLLDYFEQLQEIDTSDVPPTARMVDLSNVVRADDLQPYGDREAILRCAPEADGDFFKVPKIVSTQ
jgi:aspartyl-tRNA(Asn)/glutamyl-tRNA(Gln) amidotransferase subunit C